MITKIHENITSASEYFFGQLGSGLSKFFAPIGNWAMRTYLGMQPLSNTENVFAAALALFLFGLAVKFNFSP
jgi:hypothetical protein